MHTLALILCGHTLVALLVIAVSHLAGPAYAGQRTTRLLGMLLLASLATLQLLHLQWLLHGPPVLDGALYRCALFAVAPSFYLFARPLLLPTQDRPFAAQWVLHGLPVLAALALPPALVRPLAFGLGAAYLLWLGRNLWDLRSQRQHFGIELALLGLAVVVALGVAVLALLPDGLAPQHFVELHASAIGLALALVQMALALRPQLPVAVAEASQGRYAHSTLRNVDCDAAIRQLQLLMDGQRLYADPELSLATLAQRLGLSAHQLSELLNARIGKGFARYLREQRVSAAKSMLCAEPRASVLSVGLAVGFTSQSTFYEAFREVEGSTPGQYRKLKLGSTAG